MEPFRARGGGKCDNDGCYMSSLKIGCVRLKDDDVCCLMGLWRGAPELVEDTAWHWPC